jgi:hypothetical protein
MIGMKLMDNEIIIGMKACMFLTDTYQDFGHLKGGFPVLARSSSQLAASAYI